MLGPSTLPSTGQMAKEDKKHVVSLGVGGYSSHSRKLTGAFLDEGERFGQAIDGGRWVVMDGAALRYAGGGVYLGRGCCRVAACQALHLKDGASNDVRLVSALMLRDVLLARVHRNLLDRAYRLHFSGGLKEGERARAEGDIDWGIGCASVFA